MSSAFRRSTPPVLPIDQHPSLFLQASACVSIRWWNQCLYELYDQHRHSSRRRTIESENGNAADPRCRKRTSQRRWEFHSIPLHDPRSPSREISSASFLRSIDGLFHHLDSRWSTIGNCYWFLYRETQCGRIASSSAADQLDGLFLNAFSKKSFHPRSGSSSVYASEYLKQLDVLIRRFDTR